MPLPYYVSPEQMMKDKAEYARKGISRGKAIVALEHRDGVLLLAVYVIFGIVYVSSALKPVSQGSLS